MRPLIIELELWTCPRRASAPLQGKEIAARCRQETRLPDDAVLGLNFVPSEHDVDELAREQTEGQFKWSEFESFCWTRGLAQELTNADSAAWYLAYMHGQAIAWLHMPAEPRGLSMAMTLLHWARENGMQLRDGSNTFEPLSEQQVHSLWQGAA